MDALKGLKHLIAALTEVDDTVREWITEAWDLADV